MSTLSVGTIQSNTTSPPTINNSAGTQIGTFCRSWVNFNGSGVVATRASFNVLSITDNGTGDYTVNFTTAMPDANYSAVFSANYESTSANLYYGLTASRLLASGSCRFVTGPEGTTNARWVADDYATVNAAIFR
jgi:hypothetical protein